MCACIAASSLFFKGRALISNIGLHGHLLYPENLLSDAANLFEGAFFGWFLFGTSIGQSTDFLVGPLTAIPSAPPGRFSASVSEGPDLLLHRVPLPGALRS